MEIATFHSLLSCTVNAEIRFLGQIHSLSLSLSLSLSELVRTYYICLNSPLRSLICNKCAMPMQVHANPVTHVACAWPDIHLIERMFFLNSGCVIISLQIVIRNTILFSKLWGSVDASGLVYALHRNHFSPLTCYRVSLDVFPNDVKILYYPSLLCPVVGVRDSLRYLIK